MARKIGFDTEKYLKAQVAKILERVSYFDKLYLEFGGKLCSDNHAYRVLPGYETDTKVKMLKRLGKQMEIVHCISAKDIEAGKVRGDSRLTYENQILKDISDLAEYGLPISAVVITRFSGELGALKFKQKLENRGLRVYTKYEIKDYPRDLDAVLSEEGYGKPEWVPTEGRIVVVTAPGPGSGKMGFAMSQIYQERKRGLASGFAKFETFPIWNIELDHPVNIAYEAATADIGDYNVVDPFHLAAYGITSISYNRDVENFSILKRMIERMVGPEDPMAKYRSPTDMGVNMAKEGIVDDEVCRDAARQEIVRRFFRYTLDFVEGNTGRETIRRMDEIMAKAKVRPEDRAVVVPAREAAEEAERRRNEGKGHRGIYCGAAIELWIGDERLIVKGKNSPLMHAESAAILNAVKAIAGLPDGVHVIDPRVIDAMIGLKRAFGRTASSLDVKEVLDALAASSVTDERAGRCVEVLGRLKDSEMHTTHLMNNGDEAPLKQLGINVTTDARIPLPT
ncbi:MAG: DUF1846 family protein [Candidatus Brockarchaeota archaeon]|nr:DUF1846 family protein [Candidatus Brockarchaeota archaeon]